MRFEIERHPLLAVTACAAEGIPWEDPLATVLVFPDAVYATDRYMLARYRFPEPVLPAVPAGGLPLAACDLMDVDWLNTDAVKFDMLDRSTVTVDGCLHVRAFCDRPSPLSREGLDKILDAVEREPVGRISFTWWAFARVARAFDLLREDFSMSFAGSDRAVLCRPVSSRFAGDFALAFMPRKDDDERSRDGRE